MSGNMQMDNNYLPENDGGVWQWIFGKRVSSTIFFNSGSDDGYVGIAAPFPGRILPVSILLLFYVLIFLLASSFLVQCGINHCCRYSSYANKLKTVFVSYLAVYFWIALHL
jgi:hypothetical protein